MDDRAGNRTKGGIPLFRVCGIQIRLDYSWFIVFALVVWSLSVGYFPRQYPDQSGTVYWLAGILATVLFFLSILIHELSHSFMALRFGLKIPAITLFIFGGMAQISEEAKSPKVEFSIAVVGPITSFLLAAVFWLVKTALEGTTGPLPVLIFEYLAWINLALGVFNLFPGFPLDGGRVFRAFWWWKSGSLERATRIAADIGKGFALALMILGGLQIFAGALVGGLWFIFIGLFLRGIAEGGYQELVLRGSLEGASVREIMVENPVSVPADLPVSRLVSDYFLRHGFGGFPVERDGKVVGLVSLGIVKNVPEEERDSKKVGDVMMPADERTRISSQTTLDETLKKMMQEDIGRLLVMEDGKMLGLVTRTGLLRYIEIKRALEV